MPMEVPVKYDIGKYSLMCARTYVSKHKATPLLSGYADGGCPVDCGPDWSKEN